MKRNSTIFLRIVIYLLGTGVIALCVYLFPWILKSGTNPELAHLYTYIRYFLIGAYLAAIPFFIALYQALKLLSYIDKNAAFSGLSVKALRNIKYCAIVICIIYAIEMPLTFSLGRTGFVITFASAVIAVFAALLEKLFQNALDIKSENDLTV